MKKLSAFACFGVFCSFGLLTASAAEGVITADRLNIRLKPDLKAPVAVRLDRGTTVDVRGESGEFVEIAAPVATPVYISAVYLNANQDKTTAPTKMYVAGAVQAASYGELPKGSVVKVLKIDQHQWAKIEPPAELKLYAAKRYVRYIPDANPETEAKPESLPETKPEAKPSVTPAAKPEAKPESLPVTKPKTKPSVTPAAKPEAKPESLPETKLEATPSVTPAAKPEAQPESLPETKPTTAKMSAATEAALRGLQVTPTPPAGDPVTARGTLAKLESTTVPLLQYALMNGKSHIYYVCSDQVKLAELGDSELTFQGRSFKVPDWKVPILFVESALPVQ